jgi:hypothetical protein
MIIKTKAFEDYVEERFFSSFCGIFTRRDKTILRFGGEIRSTKTFKKAILRSASSSKMDMRPKYVGEERYYEKAFERGRTKMRLEILEELAKEEALREAAEEAAMKEHDRYTGYSTNAESGTDGKTSCEKSGSV